MRPRVAPSNREELERRLGCLLDRESDSAVVLAGCTSQVISKRRRDRAVDASLAPDFMPKRDPELIGIRG